MPHLNAEQANECKRRSRARIRAQRKEEYRSNAPAFNVVARKLKAPQINQFTVPPPISLAPLNILTLAEIEAKYGKIK